MGGNGGRGWLSEVGEGMITDFELKESLLEDQVINIHNLEWTMR
jgi:hypothetical protein